MKIVIKKASNDEYYWNLISKNNKVVNTSVPEFFKTRQGAKKNIWLTFWGILISYINPHSNILKTKKMDTAEEFLNSWLETHEVTEWDAEKACELANDYAAYCLEVRPQHPPGQG